MATPGPTCSSSPGRVAPPEVRDTHLDRSVAGYFKQGQQSPVVYVNCR